MSELEPSNRELVFAGADGEPFTTSLVIATETGNQHKNVLGIIRTHLADLKEVGRVAFETQSFTTAGGPQRREVAMLDEPAAALLITNLKGSPVVWDFRKRLVAGFYAMRQQLSARPELTDAEIVHRALTITARQIEALKVENRTLAAAIERDAPLVAKAEAHTGSDGDVHRQEFSREVQQWGLKQGIEIRQAEVMRFLGHIGLFIRGDRSDTGHATADATRRGLAFTHKGTAKNDHAYAVGKLTPAGQDYAWKMITRYVANNGSLVLPQELRGGETA